MTFQYNNVITASRMGTAMTCWRKHFWYNEVGLRKIEETSAALRFGTAWHAAMEARWNGLDYDDALASAFPEDARFDEFEMAKLSALLFAYYQVYGEREHFGKLHPEIKFSREIKAPFSAQGKIDGLGSLKDGRSAIIESKTTKDYISPGSDYWLRLDFNVQVLQYLYEARQLGWDVTVIYYDVTHKPGLEPKEAVEELDADGLKIVLGEDGERVINAKGQHKGKPKQSADKERGQRIKSHPETADEYCDRVFADCKARPDFYFVRKQMIPDDKLVNDFVYFRLHFVKMLQFFRGEERGKVRDPRPWIRNISEDTCTWCPYKDFCLQNLTVDLNHPPQGFEIGEFNPELK